MRIVMIHGQNHKGSTYHVGREFVDSIRGDKEIKEFFLPRDLNHFCVGCYGCVEDETKCPFYEEKHAIMQEVEQADLLVFTTPNYCLAPSAPMKSFMDLTFTYWLPHKPRSCMFSKKAVVIATTAGTGANQAIKPIIKMLEYWGVSWVKKYGIAVQAMNWNGVADKKKQKIKKDMEKLAKCVSRKGRIRVLVKTKFLFMMMRMMHRGNMGSGPAERRYWEEKGWLGKERPWKKK